jgi:hypothetical protein
MTEPQLLYEILTGGALLDAVSFLLSRFAHNAATFPLRREAFGSEHHFAFKLSSRSSNSTAAA